MNIVYYCYGGAHSSVLAAGIHLGLVPIDRIPSAEEIEALPHYDLAQSKHIGNMFFMGRDEDNNNIYILGMGSDRKLIVTALISLLDASGIDHSNLILINALKNINLKTRIGGFLSRRLGLVGLGRPLTIKGLQERYSLFCGLVKGVKERVYNITNKT